MKRRQLKGQWEEYSLIFAIPTDYNSFRLRLDTSQTIQDDIDFDNVRLTKIRSSKILGFYTNGNQCVVGPDNLTPIENLGWTANTVLPGQTITLRTYKGSLPSSADFYAGIYTQISDGTRKLQSLLIAKAVEEMQYNSDNKDMGFCATLTIPDLPVGNYTVEGFVWETQSMRPLLKKNTMHLSVK